MSWNSITFGLLAQDRITRYLKEAADDQRAAAVARRTPARALPGAAARVGLLGMAVRALMPKRGERGSRGDTLGGDAC
jgi:hypothetical protein